MNSAYLQNNDSPLKAHGRFGRFSYLAWNCLMSFATSAVLILFAVLFPSVLQMSSNSISLVPLIIIGLVYLVMIYFSFIFIIRRLHDCNHTGWLSLLIFVPLVNLFLALYLLFAPGNKDTNSFGPPRPTAGWESILAWIYIILIVLGIVGVIILSIFSGLNSA